MAFIYLSFLVSLASISAQCLIKMARIGIPDIGGGGGNLHFITIKIILDCGF